MRDICVVLGLYGQDLLDERRREEMLLFICKYSFYSYIYCVVILTFLIYIYILCMYVCINMCVCVQCVVGKHRLVLVKRSIDGETAQVQPVEPEQSEYLIEFKSDRLYSENKITPVNISNTEDSLANSNKMFKRGNFPSPIYMYLSL